MRKKMMGGGMMQRPMYKSGSTVTKGNIRHGKLKSQKELKKITDSKEYKKSDFGKKTKMLNVATMATGGSVEDKIRKIGLEVKASPLPKKTKNLLGKLKKAYSKRPGKKMGGSLKSVPAGNKGLKKLPTEVRNKMGFMKKGGVVSDTKKKQFKANQAGQKATNKKAMKVAKTIGKIVIPGAAAADVGVKIARKFKGDK